MPGCPSIFNQEKAYRLLSAFIRNRCIPHALLFSGAKGVGKRQAATFMAQLLNCRRQSIRDPYREGADEREAVPGRDPLTPCGVCRPCRKIDSGTHPDIKVIKPSGSLIKIAQVRSLRHTLSLKPYETGFRVVIIHDAHFMNTPAGNALLKMLEEPPERTVVILITDQPAHILPTVISRCQPIRFDRISEKALADCLVGEHGAGRKDAALIASMAEGSYPNAVMMLETGWVALRSWLVSEIESPFLKKPAVCLALAEKLSRNKETLPQVLAVIQSWFRDLMVCRYDVERVIHKDLYEQVKKASRRYSIDELARIIEVVSKTQGEIQTHVNLRSLLETMLIQLA